MNLSWISNSSTNAADEHCKRFIAITRTCSKHYSRVYSMRICPVLRVYRYTFFADEIRIFRLLRLLKAKR